MLTSTRNEVSNNTTCFAVNAVEKEKLMEHHQQQHQMAPPKMDDKERDPEQVRPSTPSD